MTRRADNTLRKLEELWKVPSWIVSLERDDYFPEFCQFLDVVVIGLILAVALGDDAGEDDDGEEDEEEEDNGSAGGHHNLELEEISSDEGGAREVCDERGRRGVETGV